jgi:hypothetical protein
MLSYTQFIAEHLMAKPVVPQVQSISINYADETLAGFRIHLLDAYMKPEKDKAVAEEINKCITTYVYALDKRLKIDSDIVDRLAKAVNKTPAEMSKELDKETRQYYDKSVNIIA